MAVWPLSELLPRLALVLGAVGHVPRRGRGRGLLEQASAAYWRAIALCAGLLGLCPVRGWPARCKPFRATAACAAFLAGALLQSLSAGSSLLSHPSDHTVAISITLLTLRLLALLASLRRRGALADTSDCLRLYCARRVPATARRCSAATSLLGLLLPLKMAMYLYDVVAFAPKYSASTGFTQTIFGFCMFIVQQLQWGTAFSIMLHPMLVVGSLAGDLRQSCSRLARERLAPYKQIKDARPNDVVQAWRRIRLEQQMLYDICIANYVLYQELIMLVVVNTLITPSIYLASSILEIVRADVSPTTAAAALVGPHYFVDLGVFSFICQSFFFENARSKEVLHGFLVQADPRQIEENGEVSMFIKQIESQTKCSVWGLFQIDTNFTLGVFLAATTYVALLCQIGASFLS